MICSAIMCMFHQTYGLMIKQKEIKSKEPAFVCACACVSLGFGMFKQTGCILYQTLGGLNGRWRSHACFPCVVFVQRCVKCENQVTRRRRGWIFDITLNVCTFEMIGNFKMVTKHTAFLVLSPVSLQNMIFFQRSTSLMGCTPSRPPH